MARGEVLRDHPAEGDSDDEVGTATELVRDELRDVVGHVRDPVSARHPPATRHDMDRVPRVDERLEPPS